MICYSCVHFDESSNRCMWLDISLIGGTVGHCDAFVDIEEVDEEAYEIIRKMFRGCCDCIYYDLWEGICVSAASDRRGESVVGLGICEMFEEEKEESND